MSQLAETTLAILYPDTALEMRVRILGEMKKAVLVQLPSGDRA